MNGTLLRGTYVMLSLLCETDLPDSLDLYHSSRDYLGWVQSSVRVPSNYTEIICI